ncbi:SMI1/KNR4 family protein [Kosakonia cowanii]|uniref:SMI1/KNR4 family protein n=1 Tax=Kosakonia sp. HypNH10 TaxID=2980101 RepID=UPI0024499CED|nr:SMI1/KNR4 family protein [Kosakonia sp. HypNH10]MDH2913770.1 SMI1/KNR4 family protein [Kosakonia sp. HypNH10]
MARKWWLQQVKNLYPTLKSAYKPTGELLMYLSDSEKPLTSDDISKFNELFKNKLPESFKNFYLKNNGGYPLNYEDGNIFMLGGFVPITYGKLPIERLYYDLFESFVEIKDMLPFAYDYGGNSFLLSLREDDSFGEVFVFLMDEKEVVFISDSFSEFLEELFA